jgi:hypothetical protein
MAEAFRRWPGRRVAWRELVRWWPIGLACGVAIAVAGVMGMLWYIQGTAHDEAAKAQRRFGGDRVQALIQTVEADTLPLRERNRAVWALGQLRDPRALPVLRAHHTGAECQHDRFLCQEEIEKAIGLITGERTFGGWLSRQADRLSRQVGWE